MQIQNELYKTDIIILIASIDSMAIPTANELTWILNTHVETTGRLLHTLIASYTQPYIAIYLLLPHNVHTFLTIWPTAYVVMETENL